VIFDIDDVSILGTTSLPAVVDLRGQLHPRHDGSPSAVAGLNDEVKVMVYGSSTSAGDPVDLNTDDIDPSTVRIGQLGGAYLPGSAIFNLDRDSDGQDDARFSSLKSETGGSCDAFWMEPTDVAFRAELTTGEIVAGLDTSIISNCDARCH